MNKVLLFPAFAILLGGMTAPSAHAETSDVIQVQEEMRKELGPDFEFYAISSWVKDGLRKSSADQVSIKAGISVPDDSKNCAPRLGIENITFSSRKVQVTLVNGDGSLYQEDREVVLVNIPTTPEIVPVGGKDICLPAKKTIIAMSTREELIGEDRLGMNSDGWGGSNVFIAAPKGTRIQVVHRITKSSSSVPRPFDGHEAGDPTKLSPEDPEN